MIPDTAQRLAGGLIGLLVGDALGVPYEFHASDDIPPLDQIEMVPPAGFARAHAGTEPGTWSDDGALALCLLASLLRKDRFDPSDFANRLINWYDHGYMAVDFRVFDVGVQTAEAIDRLKAGALPLQAGGDHQYSQGNGSLMRVLPLVLWHQGADAEMVEIAHDQSRLTHGHPVVMVCCAFYCLWALQILEGSGDPWGGAKERLRQLYAEQPVFLDAFETVFRDDAERVPRGSGYVVDSIFSAKFALEAGDYEAVVKAAIALGNDTDTTACIAGGLAGLRDGLDAIPERWKAQLRGREEVASMLEQLIGRRIDD